MARERHTASRRLLWARLGWTALTVVWCVSSGYLAAQPSAAMRAYLPWGGAHLALSVLLWVFTPRFDPRGQQAWLWVLLLDLPAVFIGQYQAIELSRNPLGRADGVALQLLLLVLVSQLGMRARHIFVVAGAAAGLHLLLLHHAGLKDVGGRLLLTPIFFGLAALICAYLPSRLRELVRAAVDQEQSAGRLRRYFSPSVMRAIEDGSGAEMSGVERQVSVLVVDIRGFTALSARLEAPAVVALLNTYLGCMVAAVFDAEGTLDKFVGDGLIAYFGAPVPQVDHAARAVRCGLEVKARVDGLNQERASQGLPTVEIGVGINTGRAVVGDVGVPHRREFTVIGDAVNVAARTESLTRELGQSVLCTDATRVEAGEAFSWSAQPPRLIKGKSEPLLTWVPALKA